MKGKKMGKNHHGLDTDYFKNYMKVIIRDIHNYTPRELRQELNNMRSALLSEKPRPPKHVEGDTLYGDKPKSPKTRYINDGTNHRVIVISGGFFICTLLSIFAIAFNKAF